MWRQMPSTQMPKGRRYTNKDSIQMSGFRRKELESGIILHGVGFTVALRRLIN
jgi:hypothetical protein